jgi:hypothetical protein
VARRSRLSAGADVARSAEQLSDELLDLELAAYAEIEAIYAQLAEDVAAELEAKDDERWDRIDVLIVLAGLAAIAVVALLLASATGLAVAAIAAEMKLIEATLPSWYTTVAVIALSRIASDAARADHLDTFTGYVERISESTIDAVATARARWEGDELTERLTAPTVDRPDQKGRGIVRRPGSATQSRAREVTIDLVNTVRESGMDAMNSEIEQRGGAVPVIYKQVLAVIDNRTTIVCLGAAGQIRQIDEPFQTLNGLIQRPPFHWGCRSIVIPWAPGMLQRYRAEANAELLRRPIKERRALSNSPGSPPPSLPLILDEPLPDWLANDPRVSIDDVPPEHRIAYMRAHPERFAVSAGSKDSWWVTDSSGRRWNARR